MIQNVVVVNHLPISVAFGVLFPSFMLSGRSKFLNTLKKAICKIVILQGYFSILFLSLSEIVLVESVSDIHLFLYKDIYIYNNSVSGYKGGKHLCL